MLLDYFIDKIYIYDDHLEITGWFSDDKRSVEWRELSDGTIEFNVFAPGSTNGEPDEPKGFVWTLPISTIQKRQVKTCRFLYHGAAKRPLSAMSDFYLRNRADCGILTKKRSGGPDHAQQLETLPGGAA